MFLRHFLVSYRELKIHHPRAPCSHNPGYAYAARRCVSKCIILVDTSGR